VRVREWESKRASAREQESERATTSNHLYMTTARYPSARDGSTAIVAMVWSGMPSILAVANVGDSRGLLVSENRFIPLSQDHKPHCVKEKARIEAAGGRVLQDSYPFLKEREEMWRGGEVERWRGGGVER
jgi:serine/threonine protein phosphatase PrpC